MRLNWPDTVKGMAILWIVYFHGFTEYRIGTYPWALDDGYLHAMCATATSLIDYGTCATRAAVVAFSSVGFHCVGVFILLSGFTLGISAARQMQAIDWRRWYRSRITRLFPLYWAAHVIYLLSPPQVHLEAVDYRFLLSFLGDRVFPLMEVFFYANAAWWYFGLLLQLYLIFPLLFEALRRFGSGWFLAAAAVLTALSRYIFLFPLASEYSEPLLLGAFFTSRLFEFAMGMVLARAFVRDPDTTALWLGGKAALVCGVLIYIAGLYSYSSQLAYVATDALIGCGLALILCGLALRIEPYVRLRSSLARVGAYSYGLYLLHQPYMTWLGTTLRGIPLPSFIVVDLLVTALLAFLSMLVEKRVNALAARWLG